MRRITYSGEWVGENGGCGEEKCDGEGGWIRDMTVRVHRGHRGDSEEKDRGRMKGRCGKGVKGEAGKE